MARFTSIQNRKFWDKDAVNKKENPIGTHSDPHLVELENHFIFRELKSAKIRNLLDIGCGNGQRTIKFSKLASHHTLGIDYSQKMIEQAKIVLAKQKKSVKKKVSFIAQDIQKFKSDHSFDAIVSCRCFINQTSYSHQVNLFRKLHKLLTGNGSLVIAEGSEEGYNQLNSIRKKFGLRPVKISWYNLPIKENFVLPKIKRYFAIKTIKRLGVYYYLSRVIHPALIYPKLPDPKSKINDLAMKTELILHNKHSTSGMLENVGGHLLVHFRKK